MTGLSAAPIGSGLRLESAAFREGEAIPLIHSGDGLDLSPPLRWWGETAQTRSFTLVLEDPDAPAGVWLHWLLFDIPASIHALPAGLPREPVLANGARHGRCWGVEQCTRLGYYGPQPPLGASHRYRFMLTALDTHLDLPAGATLETVRAAMAGHVLAETLLTGFYHRHDH